jgi:tetratricopeptide (TPR) repeat protein
MKRVLILMLMLISSSVFSQSDQYIDSLFLLTRNPKSVCKKKCFADTVIADAYSLLGNALAGSDPDTSLFFCNRSIEVIEKALKQHPQRSSLRKWLMIKKGRYINERGWSECFSNESNKSIRSFNDSRKIAEEFINEKDKKLRIRAKKIIASAYGGCGVVFKDLGEDPKALTYFFKALKVSEEINYKKGIAANLGNIGLVYNDMHDKERALEYYKKALVINTETGNLTGQAINMANMANIYQENGNNDLARETFLKAIKINSKAGNFFDVAIDLGNVANVFLNEDEYDSAIHYYKRAIDLNKELDNLLGETNMTGNLGNVYLLKGDLSNAEKYLLKFLKLATELKSKNELFFAHKYLSALYESTNRFDKALGEFKLSVIYNDSVFNEENNKKIIRAEMDHEYDKKAAVDKAKHKKELENQKAITMAESRKQKMVLWSVGVVLMIVVIFAFFIFRTLGQTRKQKLLIEEKTRETQEQKLLIEEKQTEIIDSIKYARRIQMALLPTKKYISRFLNNKVNE